MLNWIDNKIADISDAVSDFFWVWCGVERITLARGIMVVYAFLAIHVGIVLHDWISIFLRSWIFTGCYIDPEPQRDTLLLSALRMFCLTISFFSVVQIVFHLLQHVMVYVYQWEYLGIITMFTWYQYLTLDRDNGQKNKKERRHAIDELIAMFGIEWIPTPVKGN